MEDIVAIQRLKARYFRYLDTKDWDGFTDLLEPDLEVDVTDDTGAEGPTVGRDAFVSTCARVLRGATTVHHGHMPDIELTGPDTASGVWAMEDYVDWGPGADGALRGFRGYGHYHESYRRGDDGRWRIARLRLTRLRRDWL